MALFDDASLVTTPNGYKAGTLYSIKPTSGAGDMTVVRATTATRVNSAGLIESVANNVPRLDYSNGTCPCLLVEPQRSNLILYSEQFDNAAWTKVQSSVTANATTSPDGTANADKFIANTTSNIHFANTSISNTASAWTYSLFAKAAGYDRLIMWVASTNFVGFNLTTGIVESTLGVGITSANIENYGNGWFRCSITSTSTASGTSAAFAVFNAAFTNGNVNPIFAGNGTDGIYIWGAQLEAGSYPTSYIPTTSAAVTRNADEIYKTGISSLIGQTEGAMFLDFIFKTPRSTTDGQLGIANTSGSDRVIIWNNFTLNTLGFQIRANGANVISNVSLGSFVDGTRYKIAIAYKSGDTAVYVNGSQIITDSSAFTFPTSVTDFILGSYAIPYQCHQRTNATALWKTRLTNAELAQLTTI